jgi:hypothetical protein
MRRRRYRARARAALHRAQENYQITVEDELA